MPRLSQIVTVDEEYFSAGPFSCPVEHPKKKPRFVLSGLLKRPSAYPCPLSLLAWTRHHQSSLFLPHLHPSISKHKDLYTQIHQPPLFDLEDGGRVYVRNVGSIAHIHTVTNQEHTQHHSELLFFFVFLDFFNRPSVRFFMGFHKFSVLSVQVLLHGWRQW
jgi:hypothetical protein